MSEIPPVVESTTTDLPLTAKQAEELRRLGHELRGRAEFHGRRDEADGAEIDPEEDAELRTVIRCTPKGDGVYSVRVANAVGVVALPDGVLRVVPKIDIDHFAHLARLAIAKPRTDDGRVAVDSLDALWEVVAHWCVTEVESLVRAGLIADYKAFTEDLQVVRGRPDVRATAGNFMRGRPEVNCTFEEMDLDHPLNRVLRAAMKRIAGDTRIVDMDVRQRASRMDRAMDGIGVLRLPDLRVGVDRRTMRYAAAVDLCRRVLSVVGTNIDAGERFGKTFLIPTPGLVEDAVFTVLSRAVAPVRLTKERRRVSSAPYFSVNPDLVFDGGLVTGDVKYKQATGEWNRGEVQQAVLFATAFKARSALIATFGRDERATDLSMMVGDLCVTRIVWKAIKGTDPRDAESDFVSRVRSVLGDAITAVAAA